MARVQFEHLVFPTPSGKIEVASAVAEKAGHARCPFPHSDPLGEPGSFRLLTPASRWILNSIFSENPSNSKLVGPHAVLVHPSDAAALGLSSGDKLRLWNAMGSIVLEAQMSEVTIAGVLLSHKNAYSCTDLEVGVNALNPGEKTDMGENSSVHGTRVFAERLVSLASGLTARAVTVAPCTEQRID
jgi:anaerobic selenocysteine-containing dehydrogenase